MSQLYARIENGVVVEIESLPVDPSQIYDASLTWVSCADNALVTQGWTYSQEQFSAPPAPPAPSVCVSALEFMALLTSAEQLAITTAAVANAPVLLYLLKLTAATYVNLSDPNTIGGVNALVGAGLLTSDRGTQILANTAAPVSVS